MAQWLRMLAAPSEDQGSVPSGSLTTVGHSSSRGSDSLFWPPRTYNVHKGKTLNT